MYDMRRTRTGADYFQRDAPSEGGDGGRRRYNDFDDRGRGGYRDRDRDRNREDRGGGSGGSGGRQARLAFTEEGEEDACVPGLYMSR